MSHGTDGGRYGITGLFTCEFVRKKKYTPKFVAISGDHGPWNFGVAFRWMQCLPAHIGDAWAVSCAADTPENSKKEFGKLYRYTI